jgi:hypothetical protein
MGFRDSPIAQEPGQFVFRCLRYGQAGFEARFGLRSATMSISACTLAR